MGKKEHMVTVKYLALLDEKGEVYIILKQPCCIG